MLRKPSPAQEAEDFMRSRRSPSARLPRDFIAVVVLAVKKGTLPDFVPVITGKEKLTAESISFVILSVSGTQLTLVYRR
jgi:hypothetical protein